jgi:hypothetical protein
MQVWQSCPPDDNRLKKQARPETIRRPTWNRETGMAFAPVLGEFTRKYPGNLRRGGISAASGDVAFISLTFRTFNKDNEQRGEKNDR